MLFTEEQIFSYSKPISDTEGIKCENAIRMVSDALKRVGYSEEKEIQLAYTNTFAYETKLKKNDTEIKLLVQGSYANKTNVRSESDVDIAVIQENIFVTNYRAGISGSYYGFNDADYSFKEYKKDIHGVLVEKFGFKNVEWRNKCLSVYGNTYRVEADTVPARRNRDYTGDFSYNIDNYTGGINIKSDRGEVIVNYPEQHIKNGQIKNGITNSFYKKMVRIIKRLRYFMKEEGIDSASKLNSFMLESLLWNIPTYKYINDISYLEKFNEIINYLRYMSINEIDSYKEANGIKNLCKNTEEKQNLIAFIEDLSKFYEYKLN